MNISEEDEKKVIIIQATIRGFLVRQDIRRQLQEIYEYEKQQLEYLQEVNNEYFNDCQNEYEMSSAFNTLKNGDQEANIEEYSLKRGFLKFPQVVPVLTDSDIKQDNYHLLNIQKMEKFHQQNHNDDRMRIYSTSATQLARQEQSSQQELQQKQNKIVKNQNSKGGLMDRSENISIEYTEQNIVNQSPDISNVENSYKFEDNGFQKFSNQQFMRDTQYNFIHNHKAHSGDSSRIIRESKKDKQMKEKKEQITLNSSGHVQMEDFLQNSKSHSRFDKISRIEYRDQEYQYEENYEGESEFFNFQNKSESEIKMMLVTKSKFQETMAAIREMQANQEGKLSYLERMKNEQREMHEKNMKKIRKMTSQHEINPYPKSKSKQSLISFPSSSEEYNNFQYDDNYKSNQTGYQNQRQQSYNNKKENFQNQELSQKKVEFDSYMIYLIAATHIQKMYRGYASRKYIKFIDMKRAALLIEDNYIKFKQFLVKKMKECSNQLECGAMNIVRYVRDFQKGEKSLQFQFRRKYFQDKISINRNRLTKVFLDFIFENNSQTDCKEEDSQVEKLQKQVLQLKQQIQNQQINFKNELVSMVHKYENLKVIHKETVQKYIEGIQKISQKKKRKEEIRSNNHNGFHEQKEKRENYIIIFSTKEEDKGSEMTSSNQNSRSSDYILQSQISNKEKQSSPARNNNSSHDRQKSPGRNRHSEDTKNFKKQRQQSIQTEDQHLQQYKNGVQLKEKPAQGIKYNRSLDKHEVLQRMKEEALRDLEQFEENMNPGQRFKSKDQENQQTSPKLNKNLTHRVCSNQNNSWNSKEFIK